MGHIEHISIPSIIIAGIVGILSGIYVGIGIEKNQENKLNKERKSKKEGYYENGEYIEDEEDEDEDEDEDDKEDEDLGIIVNSKGLNDIKGEVRMALIVRNDLGMLKGKAAAQCSHAAVSLYKQMKDYPEMESYNPFMLKRWEFGGQAKIVLKCNNFEEMEELLMKAVSLNINNYLVVDAGRTQIASGSQTVLGLGPAPRSVLDLITKDLKLY